MSETKRMVFGTKVACPSCYELFTIETKDTERIAALESALAAERASAHELTLKLMRAVGTAEQNEREYRKEIKDLSARADRLAEALEQIQYGANTNCGYCIDCNSINQIAMEALAYRAAPVAPVTRDGKQGEG